MAHEIDQTTGRDAIAYRRTGGTPWHGLGAALDEDQPLEVWAREAGLEWEAKMGQVFMADGGKLRKAPKYRICYRSDQPDVRFGVFSRRYKPMQPRQVIEFFRDLAETHGMRLETAGALKNGAIVWALASTGKKIALKGSDIVKPYLLVSTSYDGSQARRWAFTGVRVVCNNTLRLSYSKDSEGVVTMRNTGEVDEDDVKRRLGLLDDQIRRFAHDANTLVEHRPSRAEVENLLEETFGRYDEDGRLTTQSHNVIDDIKRAIVCSPGAELPAAEGTAWGVLQGVVRYVDFEARARNADNRLTSAWFGQGDRIKRQVRERLLQEAA